MKKTNYNVVWLFMISLERMTFLTVLGFLKRNVVFSIAAVAALITCFFVPPDAHYADYLDDKTLACLFLTLAVVCALRNLRFFTILARRIVMMTGTLRSLCLTLVIITFVGSMLIANDMALITFLPLGYFALSVTKQEAYAAFLFILQNISANLGGMLTPFGNPQNLYLYSYYHIPTREFLSFMLAPFLLAVALLALACLFFPKIKLDVRGNFSDRLDRKKAVFYLVLFALSILIVFRVVPYWIGLLILTPLIFIADKSALKAVDYGLLGTFVMFFIFAGNLSRLDAVKNLFSLLLEQNTFLVSTLSCQVISNVPSAILLSRFTEDYRALLLGVNVGSAGTLVSSLASLITFREFSILYPKDTKKYLLWFTVINLIFLGAMIGASLLFFQ